MRSEGCATDNYVLPRRDTFSCDARQVTRFSLLPRRSASDEALTTRVIGFLLTALLAASLGLRR